MADRWVFGYYFNFNKNYDPSLTADLTKTRWRSQYPVPQGAPLIDPQNDWLLLGNVHLVFMSDLQYFLKNTDPVGDQFWVKSVEGQRRVDTVYLAGGSSVRIQFEHPAQFFTNTNPNSTNPNAIAFAPPIPTPKPNQSVGYLSFSEEKLELGYDYGAVGGMSFSNEIVKMADDSIEQRNANLHLPLGRWQLGDRLIAESATDDLAEVTYLRQFHLDRVGSFQGFRFRDWSDFEGIDEDIATGDGVKTQFQLRKVYTVTGSWSYRPIMKPVAGSVLIYVDQIPETEDWTIDYTTGVISKSVPVPDGARITASFQFDVPVWFESDQIGFSLEGYEEESGDAIYRLESVFVVEQRLPMIFPWQARPLTQITDTLDLGIVYDTSEQYQFLTDKQVLRNGYVAKISKYGRLLGGNLPTQNATDQGSNDAPPGANPLGQDSRLLFNLGSKNYDLAQVNRILDFFWNARGSLSSFNFINGGRVYRVRFDQDELNFKFEAANGVEKFFSLAGLKLTTDY